MSSVDSLRRAGLWLLCGLCAAGCASTKTTDTARTAKEQMLISNSVDQALDKVDYTPLAGRQVFLQDKYLDCVDKNYLLASIRHRVMYAGGVIVDEADKADTVLEVRSGSIGTDNTDLFVGVPQLAVPGPLPLIIPEVRFFSRNSQFGTAKIGLLAYDAKSKTPLGSGGVSVARSDDNNWYVVGIGPFQSGSVRKELSQSLGTPVRGPGLPNQVAFDSSTTPRVPRSKLILAGGAAEEAASAKVEDASEEPEAPAAEEP